ncbi:hypothetical protein [Parasphingorhabdus sp.]|uniref:hypothetical protein n=1 Tax=Parasphingorhabdus sp. TaxID=2709688 RepID=UPI0032EFA062
MNERDLNREIENACRRVKQAHLDRIRALGVTSTTIATLGHVQAPFGVMQVDNIGGGIFQPGGDTPAIVQPIYDGGCLIDLVAWRTNDPTAWLLRTGAAWALGVDAIEANSWTDAALAIDATPLDWLRGGASGLCILNWAAPEIRTLLRVKSITAQPAIARQLRGILSKPLYFPEITAREAQRNAA